MSKPKVVIAVCAVAIFSALWIASAHAQVQGTDWSQPYQLSSGAGKASEGYCVADQYGYVHCFWTETLYADGRTIIQYARFDGETWSTPNAIYVTTAGIKNVSPVVDQQGILHIAWAEGLTGPAYYTYAPANNAASARSWAPPIRIDIPARTLRLRIDSKGTLHILYINQIEAPGVYYVRSEDQGANWSQPVWLDPDIPPEHVPDSLNFELDDTDGLHAAWFYGSLDPDGQPDLVRYTRSLDGGQSWSPLFTIDHYDQDSNHSLIVASPKMIVQGQTVLVIWAAGEQSYRNYRFSTDAGQTWSASERLFGDLNGQAFDGLAVDGAGRVHFFAQIRYPQGIYHAIWDRGQWSIPTLVYLILQGDSSTEVMGDRIHAHDTLPVIRADNQIILTFADGPADPHRRLFEIHRILADVPPAQLLPTPLPTATRTPVPSPVPTRPTPTATPLFDLAAHQPAGTISGSALDLRAALLPTLILLAGAVAIQLLLRYKR